MKILVLAAIIAAVSSGRLTTEKSVEERNPWPWTVGKLYRYDVETHTLAYLPESASSGYSFRARFSVRVKAPGYLWAKLENPEYAQVHQELQRHEPMPEDLKYQPVTGLDSPFEIYMDGGRVLSMNLPPSMTLANENLLKGLIGALQADLSTNRNVHGSYDTYDKEIQQGLFRKMETDVTGDCETLYSVSPVAAEWRRDVPNFATDEEPIEITKSKNYGHCHYRVDYHFGVPEGAEWTGTAHKARKEQFIKRATVSKILVGRNGPIYKAETTSTVNVHPHLYGEQEAEVHSKVSCRLVSYNDDTEPEWTQPEGAREIKNLLYSLTPKQVTIPDSSSSASSESFEKNIRIEQSPRVRRSAKPTSVVAINKVIIKKRSKDDSASSSSSESESAYVNDDIPTSNEPAYVSLYMNPQPHGDKKQNPMNAQKLVQEIAQQLQNPNNMPKADFLSKFNVLVRLIASMSYGQLSQASRSIEIAKTSNDVVKSDMWMIYRDAVAQAGTLPAFQQIRSWIETKKIEGEEAAEVVATLVESLRYPTKEAMTQFFELSMNPEVKNQMYLNSTAVIAATKFINMGQVNNETAHRYYPTHMFGRLAHRHDQFVTEEILPRLSEELKVSIEQGDSHKSQVYIRAIGNLGHRAILDVYAPYLEGKVPVSTYLRTRMVENLQVLAYQRNGSVRAVLYSILRNTAEPYEVRVAAIHNIFMARPTSSMMQAMALMTKEDPSIHVRATLKSVIESVAELKNPHFWDLAKSAESARNMLTREEFGAQYSSKYFMEYFERDEELGIMGVLSNIGSKDSLFPKSFKYSWKNRIGGWNEETVLSAAASSGRKLVNYFMDQMFTRSRDEAQPQHKYSAEKIAEMLNIKRDDGEPLEASLYVDFLNQQRYFAFSENDIKELGVRVGEYLSDLTKGIDMHYTKVVNKNQVSVMFPVASGMPFIYKYNEPTVVHIQSKAMGKVDFLDRENNNAAVALDKELRFTYAENHDGSIGFLDTLGNNLASVGLVRKIQVQIPVRMHLEMKSGEIKFDLKPMEPEQDSTIAHYSVWPYSANQKRDTLVTVSQDPTTKVTNRQSKTVSVDYKIGQQMGSMFQLQGYSYSNDYRNIGSIVKSYDLLSSIVAAYKQKDIAQTHFNLKYLGKQSKNKGVSLTAVYDKLYNQKREGDMPLTATEMQDSSPNSPSRRDELVKRVTSGIKTAKAQVIDLTAKFDSPQKLEYVLTFALGDSQIDPKIQYAFFAGRNSDALGPVQINSVGRFTKPSSISSMNFLEALKQDLKMDYEADIRYNGKENVHIHGTSERTKKYADELQKHPLAARCMEEMSQNNYYQKACHRMIVLAHAPDNFKFTVTYKDVSPMVRNAAYQVYRVIEGLTLWISDVNPLKVTPDGRIDVVVDTSYLANTLNVEMNSRYGEMRIRNMYIPKATAGALSYYWPIMPYERVLNYYTGHQWQPYCSVDSTKVRTFSDRDYEYKLPRSWHVVMYDDNSGNDENLVVLARRPTEKQQEMYISYRSHTGKHLEIEVQAASDGSRAPEVKVNTNAKKVSEGELTTYWDDVDEMPILEYHTEPDRVLMLKIREDRLRIMYDGSKFVVLGSDSRYRSRGICGYMSGEPRDDYLSPNGIIDRPEYYGASYALIEDDSEPETKERYTEAMKTAYQPWRRYTAILRSDEEWRNSMASSEQEWGSQIIYRARNYLKKKGPCKLQPQVQYYENQWDICITTKPLPSCQSYCSGTDYKIQPAQVVCKPKFDQQFITYRDQIRLGQNPKVKGASQATQYRVPGTCQA